MKIKKILPFLFITASLFSCSLAPLEEEKNPVMPEQTKIIEESSFFEPDEQNTVFTFETNDTKYLGADGCTLWTVPYVNDAETFEPLSVELIKESGRSEAGFGIVFCSQKIDERPFMIAVLINAGGYYTVGKVYDGVFSHINGGWKSSDLINRGCGIKNAMDVSYDDTEKTFLLKINGCELTEFTVPEEIAFKDSRSGFAVVIADNENFPDSQVKVVFGKK